jgi:hypothetical protein
VTETKDSSNFWYNPQSKHSAASDIVQEALFEILDTILSINDVVFAVMADSYFLRSGTMAVALNIQVGYSPGHIQWNFVHCTSQAPAKAYP